MRGLSYKWKVLISVIFGIFMVVLDSTVINVAYPTLRAEFHASLADSQWVISLYVMALGISTPVSAFLADRFGIKRMYVLGLALFALGSLACGVAPNLFALIVFRALEGIGGGIALPLGTAMLFNAFTVEEQGLAFGIFGIALVVAPALGPILGGWLVDQGAWRWIFFINVPVGALGVVLASFWLRENKPERAPRLDVLGLITSTVGFGAALYAASIAANDGWSSPKVLGFFALGGVSLCAFVILEFFVVREPLLNIRLFQKPIFALGTIIGWVSVLALFGAEFLLPLYLQTLRGISALDTGFILLPLAIASGFVAPFAGKLYDLVGARVLMFVGFGLLIVNTYQFAQLDTTTPIPFILFLLVLRGIALGLTVQTTLVASLPPIPGPQVAQASALSNATRQVVQSIGVAVLATILATALSPQVAALEAQLQNATPTANTAQFGLCETPPTDAFPGTGSGTGSGAPSGVGGSPAGGGPTGGIPAGGNPGVLLHEACTESLSGFQQAYQLTFYFAILALLLGILLPGWPLRWEGRKGPARGGAKSKEKSKEQNEQGDTAEKIAGSA